MSIAEWTDTYGIHHWRIFWSSYRKMTWVGFESITTEFRSDTLTEWAMRPWVQLKFIANFLQPLQFHCVSSVRLHFSCCLCQSPRLFWSKFSWGNHKSVVEWPDTYGIHCWRGLWRSYRELAWVGFEPTTPEFLSNALTNWAIRLFLFFYLGFTPCKDEQPLQGMEKSYKKKNHTKIKS